jgi:predicted GNAT family acetyltransferase
MSITIKEVISNADVKKFIDFAHELYEGDEHYVPELYVAQKEMFDKKKYPFYDYGTVQSFLAYKNNKIVGRISAITNKRYNDYHGSNIGFFGFLEFIEDKQVLTSLLEAASNALKSHNYEYLMGPTNFNTNETSGFLIDGFHEPAKIMMTYNKKYYDKMLIELGLQKEMDMFAFMIDTQKASEKSIKLSRLLEQRLAKGGITIRNISLKSFKDEVIKLKKVYNAAWEKNWGFVPFTDKEFNHMADGLKMIAIEDFAYMAEHNGEPIGFSISLPDINEITKDFKKGRLLPFNIFKLLMNRKKTSCVRILATGVKEEYRKKGIEAIFFAKNILEARKRNLKGGEASWILESNEEMVLSAEKLNGEKYKTYRLYKYLLS